MHQRQRAVADVGVAELVMAADGRGDMSELVDGEKDLGERPRRSRTHQQDTAPRLISRISGSGSPMDIGRSFARQAWTDLANPGRHRQRPVGHHQIGPHVPQRSLQFRGWRVRIKRYSLPAAGDCRQEDDREVERVGDTDSDPPPGLWAAFVQISLPTADKGQHLAVCDRAVAVSLPEVHLVRLFASVYAQPLGHRCHVHHRCQRSANEFSGIGDSSAPRSEDYCAVRGSCPGQAFRRHEPPVTRKEPWSHGRQPAGSLYQF